jgi:hypothetical protein
MYLGALGETREKGDVSDHRGVWAEVSAWQKVAAKEAPWIVSQLKTVAWPERPRKQDKGHPCPMAGI